MRVNFTATSEYIETFEKILSKIEDLKKEKNFIIVTLTPRPHSFHNHDRNSLTTAAAQENSGRDGNRHRDNFR
ncbi:hypothetical protein E2C01_093111 [Portunus trituberculatus]|uniref:Uncharacterized protein n=1 Tax=Portunus trituberculatus TaxID=210409 RepID=A0A5B7JSF8_PORTR|nr:hypothetical protein [Portunus trituberculatus]